MKLKIVLRPLQLLFLALSFILALLPSAAAQRQSDRLLKVEEVKQLPAKAKRFALVIGIDDYQDTQINRLAGATNDAKSLADALVRYAGFPQDQVILLASDQPQERQPNRGNILQYLSNLSGIVPEDGLLLVSFAGHGIERNGRGFLCPSDARSGGGIRLLESTAVEVDTVRELIRDTGVKQVLIILDACRNDPSGRGERENRLTDGFARRFNFDVRNKEVKAFATLYAADVGQVAYENKEKKQGYFTSALVEGLRGGAADEKKEVTLSSLVKYIQEKVPARIRMDLGATKQQRPFAIIEGYKADELVISVAGHQFPVNTNPPVEPAAPIIVKTPPEDRNNDDPNVERIAIGQSKNGAIIEGQYKDHLFDGVANSPLIFTLRAEGCFPVNTTRYRAGILDSRERKLKEPMMVYNNRVKEILFTPPADGHYILRIEGGYGRCKYTVYLDRP